MFRAVVVALSKVFPPKYVSDRILPWTALLLATLGACSTITQYRNDVAIERVRATLEMHKAFRTEFTDKPVLRQSSGTSLRDEIFRVRCSVIGHFDCEELTPDDKTKIDNYQLDTQQRAEVRRMLNEWRRQHMTLDTALASQYLQFFDAVRVCTLEENCDQDATIALFAKETTSYLNDVCIHVTEVGRKETLRLARFLLDNNVHKDIFWSDDKGRESLFICDYLRKASGTQRTR